MCLYLWYSIIFYWIPAYIYNALQHSTGSQRIPMVLFYIRFGNFCVIYTMVLYYHLLAPCLYIWYFTIFYWLPVYTYGTLLSSTGSLPILVVPYYILLAHCQYLWYSTIYWLPGYPYGTLLSTPGPLPIPMVFYYLLLDHCHSSTGTLLPSTASLPIPLVLYYFLMTPCLYLWYATTFNVLPAYTYGTLLTSTCSPYIPTVLYNLLLAHCL